MGRKQVEALRVALKREEVDIRELRDLLFGMSALPLLEEITIPRDYWKKRNGEYMSQREHVAQAVETVAKLDDYRRGKLTRHKVVNFINSRGEGRLNKKDIEKVLDVYTEIPEELLPVLFISIILHDIGKIANLDSEAPAGGRIVEKLFGLLADRGLPFGEQDRALIELLVSLHNDFNSAHFGEGMLRNVFQMIEARIASVNKRLDAQGGQPID